MWKLLEEGKVSADPEGEKERVGRREGSLARGRGSVFAKACR